MADPKPIRGPRELRLDGPRTEPPDRRSLIVIRDTMNSARRTVMLARRAPADLAQLRDARVAQLLAMTQYELALTRCSLPIPPRLHSEAQLLRHLLA